MENKRKIISYIAYALFVLIFAWVSAQLFFKKSVDNFLNSVLTNSSEEADINAIRDLRVIYPDEPVSLEPTLFDPTTRARLLNIFEPLVRPDKDLKMRPALALSWGLIDDLTWEFTLRPGVKFHNDSDLDVLDAMNSILRAMNYSGSQLLDILGTIDKVEAVDGMTLRVITKEPDPLLLQRLSTVLIFPFNPEIEANKDIEIPNGTGSYMIASWDIGKEMDFVKFEDYWGNEAKFENIKLLTRENKSDRVNKFLRNEAEFLSFVPYDAIADLTDRGFLVASVPTLEVQMLLFNFDSDLVNDVEVRRAVSLALNKDILIEKVGASAKKVSQFVSNGIFGFNPNIEKNNFDQEAANALALKLGLKGKTLRVHLPLDLDVLGEYVRKSLSEIGLNVVVSYLDKEDFVASLNKGDADMYFLGFKSELGDSIDFLNTIVHSEGAFNIEKYKNDDVDFLIEKALTEMDIGKRRDYLQEVMRVIVEDDVLGIPLFEYETVYGFVEGIEMQPRIDGLIYFDELK